jgi:DNA anti-recombination protein RmuC
MIMKTIGELTGQEFKDLMLGILETDRRLQYEKNYNRNYGNLNLAQKQGIKTAGNWGQDRFSWNK